MKNRNTSVKSWLVLLIAPLMSFSLSNGIAQMQTVNLADDLTAQEAHETSVGPVLTPTVASWIEQVFAR